MKRNNKRINNIERYIYIILVVILISIISIIIIPEQKLQSLDEVASKEYQKLKLLLEEAIKQIKNKYYNENIIKDDKNLIYGALDGMLKATDSKWNSFYDENDWDSLWDRLNGELVGIGIYTTEDPFHQGVPLVIKPLKNSPAHKSGIISDDRIVKINGEETEGHDYVKNLNKITGDSGTKLTLTIQRNKNLVFDVDIIREKIKIYTVESDLINKDIAYIKLRRFSNKTDKDLEKSLNEIKLKGVKKLIIDVRNNPGGLLDVCIDICDMFISDGIICTTKGRRFYDNRKFKADKNDTIIKDYTIVILVNEHTASAAEIFTGSLKDHNIATVIGTNTYGKGRVAELMPLRNNTETGISIVIQKYFLPSGKDINKVGIKPDVIVEDNDYTDNDLFYLKKIRFDNDRDLIYDFVKNNSTITEYDIKEFHSELLNNNYMLTYDVLKREIIKEKDRYIIKLFDIDIDFQLKEAVNFLNNE